MKHLGIVICLTLSCIAGLAENPKIERLDATPPVDEKARHAAVMLLLEKLYDNKVSADAAWEVFSTFVDQGESVSHKVMAFANILYNGQAPFPERTGYPIRPNGPFVRDCSAALSISRRALVEHFTTSMAAVSNQEENVLLDAKKLFRSFGTKELESLIEKDLETQPSNATTTTKPPKTAEQAGADQPATKPADKPSVKDQPSTPTSKDLPR